MAEAIRAGRAREVLVARQSRASQGLDEVLREAEGAGVPVRRVDRAALEPLETGEDQGVVALIAPPRELDERALASIELASDAVVVILDGITDPQNLGACARSAEAAGAVALVARRRRAAPVSSAAIRASAGSLFHIPLARVPNLSRAMKALKERGVFVVGLDHRAERSLLGEPAPDGPVAIVVGAEGAGISRLVREECDLLLAIPVRGRTSSLNAAAALAVGLFAYARRPPEA